MVVSKWFLGIRLNHKKDQISNKYDIHWSDGFVCRLEADQSQSCFMPAAQLNPRPSRLGIRTYFSVSSLILYSHKSRVHFSENSRLSTTLRQRKPRPVLLRRKRPEFSRTPLFISLFDTFAFRLPANNQKRWGCAIIWSRALHLNHTLFQNTSPKIPRCLLHVT